MPTFKKFKVNELITVKLYDGEYDGEEMDIHQIVIDVAGENFEYCGALLLNNSVIALENSIESDTIDELAEKLGWSGQTQKNVEYKISLQTEFFGLCSNLQVWSEHNYNVTLLHTNLAFPLLKRLADVGDSLAKRVFRDEIINRFKSWYPPVVKFLLNENYLEYLDKEEIVPLIIPIFQDDEKFLEYHEIIRDLLTKPDKKFIKNLVKNWVIDRIENITQNDILLRQNYKSLLELLVLSTTITKKPPRLLKPILFKIVENGTPIDIQYLLDRKYFDYFNNKEILHFNEEIANKLFKGKGKQSLNKIDVVKEKELLINDIYIDDILMMFKSSTKKLRMKSKTGYPIITKSMLYESHEVEEILSQIVDRLESLQNKAFLDEDFEFYQEILTLFTIRKAFRNNKCLFKFYEYLKLDEAEDIFTIRDFYICVFNEFKDIYFCVANGYYSNDVKSWFRNITDFFNAISIIIELSIDSLYEFDGDLTSEGNFLSMYANGFFHRLYIDTTLNKLTLNSSVSRGFSKTFDGFSINLDKIFKEHAFINPLFKKHVKDYWGKDRKNLLKVILNFNSGISFPEESIENLKKMKVFLNKRESNEFIKEMSRLLE